MLKSRKLLLGIGVTLVVGVIIGSMLAGAHKARASTAVCGGKGVLHQVTIKNDQVSPEFTDGKLCDRLEITNQDHVTREVAFGGHQVHVPYNGVAEKSLNQNQSFTLILNLAGQFHFHDHEHDEVMGYFNVSN
jgi:hypothetical protein